VCSTEQVQGNSWVLRDTLHPATFGLDVKPRPEMVTNLKKVLRDDIKYRIPYNYMQGAGDTYFSGKMLSKLGRILVIDEGMGKVLPRSEFNQALGALRASVEVWINGSAVSPFLYDKAW
jgi:Glycosyl hydrolase family 81 C-terminal domain